MRLPEWTKNALLRNLLKFLFVGLLLLFLAKRGFLSIEETKRALGQTHFILPAFGAMALATLLGILRWHLLLLSQGIHLPFLRTLELSFVGLFFNIALPGAVSGDVVKAIYVGKEKEGMRAPAFSSILFDRVAGSSALILVSAGALIFSLNTDWGVGLFKAIQLIVAMTGSVIIAFYIYLFMVHDHRDPLNLMFKRLSQRFRVFDSIQRIYEGIKSYRQHRRTVVYVLTISFFIHLLVTFACLYFSRALGQDQVPPLAVFVIVPLALLVTAIPIMPAGVGTGHAAFLALFALVGSQRGADIFNIFVLFQFAVGAFGGLVYLRFKSNQSQDPFQAISQETSQSG